MVTGGSSTRARWSKSTSSSKQPMRERMLSSISPPPGRDSKSSLSAGMRDREEASA